MQIKNFQITRSLERNTLSELFLARHVHENYQVKIRLFDQYSITNEEIREAILQRLRNSYQMRHRNIIATLDYGVEGRYMYQIQEHMDHGTLDDLLEKVSHIPPEITAFLLHEVLSGLQYAHNIGIFHGMLHPNKVLLASNGIVKIDDFQFLDVKNTFLKQVQTKMKAKQQMYMAPEHLLGKDADHRSDIFSVGVMAYKMLTGKHPFLEEKSEWTAMQIIACNAKLLFELDPTLPPQLEELVERMIEKEITSRIQNAEEAVRILGEYIDRFGDIRSYEVLANFLRKPQQSVEQLNLLRAEEMLQHAAQLQLHEQWDRALVAYSRAHFIKPKDKGIENEIKSICARRGYLAADSKDPKFVQLEQSLRASPDNIQILQRLATLAKSRGDLMKCIAYHKRILKIHPGDAFATSQLKQLIGEQHDRDVVLSPNEAKWTRWQDFYSSQQRSIWSRWTILQGNVRLAASVIVLTCSIGVAHFFDFPPGYGERSLPPPLISQAPVLIANQKTDAICDQAVSVYRQGAVPQAIEILTKAPLLQKGPSAARAKILLADYNLQLEELQQALVALESIDLPTASLDQKLRVYHAKAEIYRRQGRYGHAIDQYINIEALPGLSATQRQEADAKIQALQSEALLKQSN